MVRENFRVGDYVQHFKRSANPVGLNYVYVIVGVGAKHTETGERFLVYRALYGDKQLYARPLDMAMEKVEREKYPLEQYPSYTQEYRLEKVTDPDLIHKADIELGLSSSSSNI